VRCRKSKTCDRKPANNRIVRLGFFFSVDSDTKERRRGRGVVCLGGRRFWGVPSHPRSLLSHIPRTDASRASMTTSGCRAGHDWIRLRRGICKLPAHPHRPFLVVRAAGAFIASRRGSGPWRGWRPGAPSSRRRGIAWMPIAWRMPLPSAAGRGAFAVFRSGWQHGRFLHAHHPRIGFAGRGCRHPVFREAWSPEVLLKCYFLVLVTGSAGYGNCRRTKPFPFIQGGPKTIPQQITASDLSKLLQSRGRMADQPSGSAEYGHLL